MGPNFRFKLTRIIIISDTFISFDKFELISAVAAIKIIKTKIIEKKYVRSGLAGRLITHVVTENGRSVIQNEVHNAHTGCPSIT